MAIVFISPKKKQRLFFLGIIMSLVFGLIIIFLILFLSKFLNITPNIPPGIFYDKPDITVNLNIMDSPQVKNLAPFGNLEKEFSYVVKNQSDKQISGNISAVTQDDAQRILQEAGFTVVTLKEVTGGRDNPFVAY